MEAQPNKLFEYMAAGLPVIASDFPAWRRIVDGAGCGFCVNPTDSEAVRDVCQYLLDHPEKGQEMGRNGYQAVQKRYNWNIEERKLLALYENILGSESIEKRN